MNSSDKHTDDFETLCAGYVLNALSEEERSIFEEMLQNADKSQKRLYQQLKSTANQLAFTVDTKEPIPAVKERLIQQIKSSDTDAVDRASKSNRFMMAVAASIALLIVAGALIIYTLNLNDTINNQSHIIAQQQTKITNLKHKVQQREALLSILSARTVDLVVMNGTKVNTNGYGKIIWDPEKDRALLQVSNLPTDPKNKDYQLWIMKNNKPIPAGVFSINTTDEASFFKIEAIPNLTKQNATAFAITLEPEGGVPQPTGKMYLLGSI